MPREASLFDLTSGDIVAAFFLLRAERKNIPPNWIDRAQESRKNREKELGKFLKNKDLDTMNHIQDWHVSYRKECFYHGLRALMELERKGKTKY